MTTRARDGLPEVRRVDPDERSRLAGSFGSVLRAERGMRTQVELAAAAGMNVVTVKRLESGRRRPTTSSVWRLARALRPRGTLRDRVALDERLRQAAGASLQYARTRPHVGRERVRAVLLAEADGAVVVGDHGDTLGSSVLADLARAFGRWPPTQPGGGG